VEPDRVQVKGVTGNQDARAEIARLLSDRLGQGAAFAVDVTYNERLDPARGLPSPEECLALATGVLERRQISFAPGKADIEGDAASVIADLATALADCAGAPLEIGGHTDSQGRAESNLALSQQRADAVLEALAERRLDVSAMTARGYGAAEPIADNGTEAGRVANRRIAFRLVPPEAPVALPGLEPAGAEPEDDGEAVLTPDPVAEDDVPVLEPDEGEPMGDAGDVPVGDDGQPLPDPAEPPPVTDSGVAEAMEAPGPAEPQATAPTDSAADTPDPAALVRDALATPEPGAADPAPETADPAADDWQDDTDMPGLRPLRRPEE
jgi:OOP family OmpA-OmpF porin